MVLAAAGLLQSGRLDRAACGPLVVILGSFVCGSNYMIIFSSLDYIEIFTKCYSDVPAGYLVMNIPF